MEITIKINEDGSCVIKVPNMGAILQALPQLTSLPMAVGHFGNAMGGTALASRATTTDIRAFKRGRSLPAPVPQIDTQHHFTQKKISLPRMHLSPAGWRELETLMLDIEESVDYWWKIVGQSSKPESLSSFYKEAYEGFKGETGYLPEQRSTLGKLSKATRRLNTLIRDGKGPAFLEYVRKQARIANAEVVRI